MHPEIRPTPQDVPGLQDATIMASIDLSETKVPTVHAITIMFTAFTIIVVGLRVYSRGIVVKAIGADDILIVFGSMATLAFCGTIFWATNHGLGKHVAAVSEEDMEKYTIAVWASGITYNIALGLIKASVLALYLRITPSMLFRRIVMGILCVIAAQSLSSVLSVLLQCHPLIAEEPEADPARCIQINKFYLSNSALNIFTDFLTYALPFPVLWRLQMPRPQKYALYGILGVGGFAVLASIIRLTYIVPMLTSPDGTWVIAEPMYWSVIENNVAIFAASMPSYRILAKQVSPHFYLGSGVNAGVRSTNGNSFPPTPRRTSAPPPAWATDCEKGSLSEIEPAVIIPEGRIMRTTEVTVNRHTVAPSTDLIEQEW